jgi:hypothetical protein
MVRGDDMRNALRFIAAVLASAILTGGEDGRAAEGKAGEDPLTLTAANTVIVCRPGAAGGLLREYLVKFLVPPPPGTEMADPKTCPLFSILQDKPDLQLPAGKTVVLAAGETRYVTDEDRKEMEEKGWDLMVKRKGNVVLVLGGPRGEIEFLEQVAGIRAYAPEYLWWSRPKDGKCVVPAGYVFGRKIAFFSSYYSGAALARNFEWRNYNYMANSQNGLLCYHNIASFFPPEKYGKTHPGIYPMNKTGVRTIPEPGAGAWNPCYSAKELPDLAMTSIRERAKGVPDWAGCIVMGIMDHAVECHCAECQAAVAKTGGYSNVHWAFVNEVARRCQKEFPKAKLTAFFYINIGRPSEMKLEPNIVVKVVTKSPWMCDPTKRDGVLNDMRDAGVGLGCSWWIHDWCFSGVSPRNLTYAYADLLKWGRKNGMIGAYIEWSNGQSWYLDGAKYHILMQLMKDPDQDVRALWRRYCDDLFGAGAEAMFRLHEHFAEKMANAWQSIDLCPDLARYEPAAYSAEDLALERELLEEAAAKTRDDPPVQARLAHIGRYFKAHELMASAVYQPYQLHRQFKGQGLNKELLAYYVREDGSLVARAFDYLQNEMTRPPDSREMEDALGANASYASCYSTGINAVLDALRRPALAAVDLKTATLEATRKVAGKAKEALRANLPTDARPERVKLFEAFLDKNLVLPNVPTQPVLDGDLSDGIWKQGAELKDFTERGTYRTSPHETRGRVLRVGDRIVFGVECRQDGPIVAATKKETVSGGRLWKESSVEFHFGMAAAQGGGQAEVAQYIVNANGAFQGFRKAKDNREGCQVTVKRDDDRRIYTIEAAFPLKTADYDFSRERVLLMNVMRAVFTVEKTQAEDAIITWYPTPYTCYSDQALGFVFTTPP